MFRDLTRLAHTAGATVVAEHACVRWDDGSECRVHLAMPDRGEPEQLLAVRAPYSLEAWLVFKPADVDIALGHDLRNAHWQDHVGIVLYSVKQHFPNAGAFMKAVLLHQAEAAVQGMRRAA